MEDTIAAISTALGIGAISIVRVSGKEAIEIVNQIFKSKNLTNVPSHTIHYGKIMDKNKCVLPLSREQTIGSFLRWKSGRTH